jgi:hypothetical protein
VNRLFILTIALLSLHASAIELTIEGKKYVSSTTVDVTECGEFSIRLLSDRLPPHYAEEVFPESGLSPDFIPEFYGSNRWVRQEAILNPMGLIISSANEFLPPELLPRKATYVPTAVYCQGSSLAILFWAGGNGSGAEVMLEFVRDGALIEPRLLGADAFEYLEK